MALKRARHALILLFLSILIPAVAHAAAAGVPVSTPDFDSLIEKLSGEDFDDRAEAAGKLAAQGEAARPALEKALASNDVETRAAAARLLGLLIRSGARVMAFDRNGKPVDGAEATINVWDSSDRYQQSNRTIPPLKLDADGTADIDDLKPGTSTFSFNWQKCWIAGDVSHNGTSYSSLVANVRGGKMPVLFSLSKGGSVKCTIRDKDGKPVKDADFALYTASYFNADLLDARGENQSMRPVANGTSDAAGDVLIEGVGDGVYICAAWSNGGMPIEGATIRVREKQTTVVPAMTVATALPGKCVFALRGIAEPKTAEELQAIRQAVNKAKANDPKKPEKTDPSEVEAKKDAVDPKTPVLLKNVKIFVEEEFLYEGPDAERKQRKVQAERGRNNRFRQKPQNETDENGAITLENLRAGKHRIMIKCPGNAPKTLIVEIPPGGKADLGEIALDVGGTIAFKANSANGKSISDITAFPIPEDENALCDVSQDVLGYIRGQNTWEEVRNYMTYQRQLMTRRSGETEDREKVSVKNLVPGKYSLLVYRQIQTRVQQVFLICGISVESGKTTELAPMVFPTFSATSKAVDPSYLKGKVIGAPGEALARSTIYYQATNGGSTGTNINADGTFQIHNGGLGYGGTIRIKVPGYKNAEFDCSAPDVDTSKIEIKLEKLKYGDLRMRVVDEAGKPLSGASVDTAPAVNYNYFYNYYRRFKSLKKISDAKGEVQLSGMSAGLRRILVVRDGYYLADPVRVSITPDTETQVTVMMRKGLTVSGKLNAPAGTSLENAVVTLRRTRDTAAFSVSAGASGEFSIGGLAPDNYILSADAPLLSAKAPRELELIGESKTDMNLELVKKGGCAVQLDAALKGRMAYLYDKDIAEKRSRHASASLGYVGFSYIDAEGKAEFWGVKPGMYRTYVASENRRTGNAAKKDAEKFAGRVDCNSYSEPFEVKEPKLFSELKLEDAEKLSFPDTSASATAKFVFRKSTVDPSGKNTNVQLNVTLTIKGEQCSGQYNYYQRARNQSNTSTSKLRVIGVLPPFLAPASISSTTLISGLVPGKYTIVASASAYDSMRGSQEQMEDVVAAEFEVKAGERKELGTIVIEPSKTLARNTVLKRAANFDTDSPSDEDLDAAFEP